MHFSLLDELLRQKPFSPVQFWQGAGAGFVGDPFDPIDLFTTYNGSTKVAAAGDLIGRFARQAGSFDWQQPVSGARPQWSAQPLVGARQLFVNPRAMSGASWSKNNVTVTDGVASFDGTMTASSIVSTSSVAASGAFQNPTAPNVQKTTSYIVKAGAGVTWVRLFGVASTNANAWYNLSTGQLGTVESNVTASIVAHAAGNGWYIITITGAGTSNTGIRLAAGNGNTLGTSGQELFVADPMLEFGASRTTWQNNTDSYLITQDGQPSVWLPRHTGSSFFEGPQAFGTATSGLFANAGVYAHLVEMVRGLSSGTITGQCGTTDANMMFRSYIASNTLQTRLRGTNNDSGVTVTDGLLHIIHTDINNGVVTRRIDNGNRSTLTVGAAAAETQVLTAGCHNQAAPAGYLTGRALSLPTDRSWSANAELRFNAWAKRRFGVAA